MSQKRTVKTGWAAEQGPARASPQTPNICYNCKVDGHALGHGDLVLDDAMLRLDGRVRIEQTRMMYRTPVIPMLNVLTAGITAAALSGVYPPLVLIG